MTTDSEAISKIPDFWHIKRPMTIRGIVGEYNSNKYSAELLLRELLLWVKSNHGAKGAETAEKAKRKPAPAYPRPAVYSVTFKGHKLDPFRVADIYGMPAALFEAFKKIARCGRSDKSAVQDLREAIECIERQLEMMEEDKQ